MVCQYVITYSTYRPCVCPTLYEYAPKHVRLFNTAYGSSFPSTHLFRKLLTVGVLKHGAHPPRGG